MYIEELLTEDTTENMQVLNDCVNLIIDNLPYKFEAGGSVALDIRSFHGIRELFTKHRDTLYSPALERFVKCGIVIYNTQIGRTIGSL